MKSVDIYLADIAGLLIAIVDALAVGYRCHLAPGKRIRCGGVVSAFHCQGGIGNDLLIFNDVVVLNLSLYGEREQEGHEENGPCLEH
jgi:hypothetical protein